MMFYKKSMITENDALPGRDETMPVTNTHYVNGAPLLPPFPAHLETAVFGLGCFWGAERLFWQLDGVVSTAVGYAGGFTPNPTYKEVCSGQTGHAEVVLAVFDPQVISYSDLLHLFWESHDPTQGMRQGNDLGSQYRSVIQYATDVQKHAAEASLDQYQKALNSAGHDNITTSVEPASQFYYAEDYHQQYLAKNPAGYCGIGGTGVTCPLPQAAGS